MPIHKTIKIKKGKLPVSPGVYLFKDKKGRVVYVGKATNLRSRVGSYFQKLDSHGLKTGWPQITDPRIVQMVHEVRRIDWVTTDSVIEALILEANLIRKYMPAYNVREKDDKSFLYVVITKEQWPKVMLVRGSELAQYRHLERSAKRGVERSHTMQDMRFLHSPRGSVEMTKWKMFGPYTNASAIRTALDLIRKWFPWSICKPTTTTMSSRGRAKRGRGDLTGLPRRFAPRNDIKLKPCFDYHIGRCPGVCIGAISRREYMKNIRNVILMLEGKKAKVMKNVELRMKNAAKAENFEEAEMWRRKLFALKHMQDVAVLTQDTNRHEHGTRTNTNGINVLGRIEGYDISNISGTSAVGSMVVFQDGEPRKSQYKRFRIKTVRGSNDVAMMREVLQRRFAHAGPPLNLPLVKGEKEWVRWRLPDLIVIDGGWGQVNAAQEVVDDIRRQGLRSGRRPCLPIIPIVGIAKGFKRKQDRPVFDKDNPELVRIVENYKDLLLQVRDEAHRFALAYHRKLRKRAFSTG